MTLTINSSQLKTWGGKLLMGLVGSGLLYSLVPSNYERIALSACVFVAFLIGVKLPVPGSLGPQCPNCGYTSRALPPSRSGSSKV